MVSHGEIVFFGGHRRPNWKSRAYSHFFRQTHRTKSLASTPFSMRIVSNSIKRRTIVCISGVGFVMASCFKRG
jgi:hypothetical protein